MYEIKRGKHDKAPWKDGDEVRVDQLKSGEFFRLSKHHHHEVYLVHKVYGMGKPDPEYTSLFAYKTDDGSLVEFQGFDDEPRVAYFHKPSNELLMKMVPYMC